MFFIDFDPFLFFLIGFDCFEHDRGRCGWDRVWRALIRTNSYLLRFCQHERGQNLARSEVSRSASTFAAFAPWVKNGSRSETQNQPWFTYKTLGACSLFWRQTKPSHCSISNQLLGASKQAQVRILQVWPSPRVSSLPWPSTWEHTDPHLPASSKLVFVAPAAPTQGDVATHNTQSIHPQQTVRLKTHAKLRVGFFHASSSLKLSTGAKIGMVIRPGTNSLNEAQ